jgi:hypothetical protein
MEQTLIMKNIKNYTSSVPADRSILQIEKVLIEMGATNIAKEYKNGKVDSISFAINQGAGILPFKLPAKKDPIKKLFLSQYKRPSQAQIESAEQQAERTAWRNIKEWVELQATMIKLEQVEFVEVFMPYIYSLEKGKTFFEIVKEGGFKELTA